MSLGKLVTLSLLAVSTREACGPQLFCSESQIDPGVDPLSPSCNLRISFTYDENSRNRFEKRHFEQRSFSGSSLNVLPLITTAGLVACRCCSKVSPHIGKRNHRFSDLEVRVAVRQVIQTITDCSPTLRSVSFDSVNFSGLVDSELKMLPMFCEFPEDESVRAVVDFLCDSDVRYRCSEDADGRRWFVGTQGNQVHKSNVNIRYWNVFKRACETVHQIFALPRGQ